MHAEMLAERFLRKNGSERLRVSAHILHGAPVLDLRVYVGAQATRKGVCVRVETARDLAKAIAAVMTEAGFPLD
jgi:hypothetical protein